MNTRIFDSCNIAGIKLKNRIIRSATHEGMADENGRPTEKLKNKYVHLAKGEAGAIVTGYAGIRQDGKSPLLNMLMMDNDDCIGAYREVVDAVHSFGTPIILQIAHCGRQTRSKITGMPTIAPSAIKDRFYSEDIPEELKDKGIEEIIDNFVAATLRAKKAGFDGVQLHAAHGYLLSQFLSPYMNRRKDKWGGNTENRFRIVGEIFKRVKERTGEYPVLIKINGHDGRKNGMTINEAVKIARLCEKSGCAAIEVSSGVIEDGFYSVRGERVPIEAAFRYTFKYQKIPSIARPLVGFFAKNFIRPAKPLALYNLEAAKSIKEHVSIPVIVVGGMRSIHDIKESLDDKVDFVSMCRPFIIEPDIVKKYIENKQLETKCIYCNYCMLAAEMNPLRCYYGKLGS